MHLKDCFREQLQHVWVAELPDRHLTALDILLNSIAVALIEDFGANSRVRHALEDSLFNVQIDEVTFIFAIDKDARSVRVTKQDIIIEFNTITGVAMTI